MPVIYLILVLVGMIGLYFDVDYAIFPLFIGLICLATY